MKTFEGQLGAADMREELGYLFDVDPELFGTTAHLHSRAFELEIRINTHRHTRRKPQFT